MPDEPVGNFTFENAMEAQQEAIEAQNLEAVAAPPFNDREVESVFVSSQHRALWDSLHDSDRRVIIKHSEYGFLKLDSQLRKRWVKSIESAQIFPMSEFSGLVTFGMLEITALLIKEPPEIPGCKLADWFDGGFITLMNDAPNNLVMRAHMMRVLKIDPPRELDDFVKLCDWVEKTFPKPKSKAGAGQPMFRAANPTPTTMRPQQPGVTVIYHLSEVEYGRCNYAVKKTSDLEYRVTIEDVRRLIDEGVENFDDLIRAVRDDARSADDICWDYDDEETSSREETSSDEIEIRVPDGFPVTALKELLLQEAPELLEELEGIVRPRTTAEDEEHF